MIEDIYVLSQIVNKKKIFFFDDYFQKITSLSRENLSEKYSKEENYDITNIQFALEKGILTTNQSILDLNNYLINKLSSLDPETNNYPGIISRDIEKMGYLLDLQMTEFITEFQKYFRIYKIKIYLFLILIDVLYLILFGLCICWVYKGFYKNIKKQVFINKTSLYLL